MKLGLGDELAEVGVPTGSMNFTDRFGGTILSLPRGRFAGYNWPQYSVHRGELQMLLLSAVRGRLGAGAVRTGLRLEDFEQYEAGPAGPAGVTVSLRDVRTGGHLKETAGVLVGADGIHSAVRARLHPGDGPLLWNGIRMWRGTAEGDPFLDGTTMIVARRAKRRRPATRGSRHRPPAVTTRSHAVPSPRSPVTRAGPPRRRLPGAVPPAG
ncbi:FAD-dependent monooxygenase [Streptosporangium sp. NPDC023825]|uniref:FAD-dependent monooxygenase n=1 Tax=Streptosporangium sp. NPDC023825 TaxID=3154909 RepID=UPI0034409F93